MSRVRQKRRAYTEHSYWQSYSDMMAALLLIFILMIAITLSVYRQKTHDLDLTQLKLNTAQADLEKYRLEIEKSNEELEQSLTQLQEAYALSAKTEAELAQAYSEIDDAKEELAATKSELQDIVGIRTDIIGELQDAFNASNMQVDAQTGSITFSSDVLFRYNSSQLTPDSQNILRAIIPLYLEVLLQDNYRPYIAEIIIEGHTDTDGSYQSNMNLSYNRANAVATFCQNKKNGLSPEKIEQLRGLLTVNGRSFSDPVYHENSSEVNMAGSRRVEIKFRLREDEMIEKITNILNEKDDDNRTD